MKKLLILFAAIMFAVSTSFATEPPIVHVTWDISGCSCGSVFADYKVILNIYDNANSQYAVENKIRYAGSGTLDELDIDVPEMLDYCKESYPNTPSFTVTVWGILVDDTECCTGTQVESGNCHHFDADEVFPISVIME